MTTNKLRYVFSRQSGAGKPFGPVEIQEVREGFWVYCPISGYGYRYKTIHELMRRWRIRITALNEIKMIWYCEPI